MRIVKEHDERFAEFLDTGRRLFFAKGYELVSVQEITESIGVSKGNFYHYFSSKEDMLDQMVMRFSRELLESSLPILDRTDLPAEQKLQEFFVSIRSFKLENLDLVLTVTKCIIDPRNLRFRDKYYREMIRLFAPHVAATIREGIESERFDSLDPEICAEILMTVFLHYGEAISVAILSDPGAPEAAERVIHQMDVLVRSMERILGLNEGTIRLVDPDVIHRFVDALKRDLQ